MRFLIDGVSVTEKEFIDRFGVDAAEDFKTEGLRVSEVFALGLKYSMDIANRVDNGELVVCNGVAYQIVE